MPLLNPSAGDNIKFLLKQNLAISYGVDETKLGTSPNFDEAELIKALRDKTVEDSDNPDNINLTDAQVKLYYANIFDPEKGLFAQIDSLDIAQIQTTERLEETIKSICYNTFIDADALQVERVGWQYMSDPFVSGYSDYRYAGRTVPENQLTPLNNDHIAAQNMALALNEANHESLDGTGYRFAVDPASKEIVLVGEQAGQYIQLTDVDICEGGLQVNVPTKPGCDKEVTINTAGFKINR